MGGVTPGAPSPLGEGDDLSGFSCGVGAVDSWVSRWARRAQASGTARVYVSRAGGRVAGLYSLSARSVARAGAAGAVRRNAPDPVPCTLLGMLGVDRRFQGTGLGRSLLRDAVLRARSAASVVGSRALVVEPADDAARSFYARFGFAPLDAEGRMFLRL